MPKATEIYTLKMSEIGKVGPVREAARAGVAALGGSVSWQVDDIVLSQTPSVQAPTPLNPGVLP